MKKKWLILGAAAMILGMGLASARAEVPVDYSGLNQFTLTSASNVDVTVDVYNSSGKKIGGGSDNNIPLTGYLNATLWQDGLAGADLKKMRIDDLNMQTTRGLDMHFNVKVFFTYQTDVSSGTITIADNGPSSIVNVASNGGCAFSNYKANAYGNVAYSVSGFLVNLSDNINLAAYNPYTANINGVLSRTNNTLQFNAPLDILNVQNQSTQVGDIQVRTQIHADIVATAPFQVPEPMSLLSLLSGGLFLLRRRA